MIGGLLRLALAVASVALVVSTWEQHVAGVSILPTGHDALDRFHPYLRDIRLWSTFAILILCVLIARRDALFTRIGLLAILASLTISQIPPNQIDRAISKMDAIKLEPKK